ncbi:hypothetical protein P7K49_014147 [Saguinus oedipus]|uniref:Uncharacterized protein n=1 Tax=Saguinus oedipus TaxID=9490 RepID=A0ABQ9VL15_SAGOE|nr:hypothetical protein P7K49_014147 [Saguinus oedipus]
MISASDLSEAGKGTSQIPFPSFLTGITNEPILKDWKVEGQKEKDIFLLLVKPPAAVDDYKQWETVVGLSELPDGLNILMQNEDS